MSLSAPWTWPGKGRGKKFTDDQVRAIRAIEGRTMASIAEQYGTTPGTIHKIRQRETYRHVD